MSFKKLNKHYGKKLKQLRKNHKLTQAALADYLNLHDQQECSDLERCLKDFSEDLILNICHYFHISVLEFVDDQSQKNKTALLLNKEEKESLESCKNPEIKLLIYKKLFLESKMENTDLKINALQKEPDKLTVVPSKYRIHVII